MTKLNNITQIPDSFIFGTNVQRNEGDMERLIASFIQRTQLSPVFNSGPPSTLEDFFELVKLAIEVRQNNEHVPATKRLLVLEDDPPEAIDTEAITFELSSRFPGDFSQGPIGEGKIKEVTSHVRSMRDNPDVPGEQIVEKGRYYNNFVTFYTYAKTVKVARRRVYWLESLLDSFNWLFNFYGFKVIENKVYNKEKKTIKDLELIRFPMSYIVRTTSLSYESIQELREISLKIGTSKQ